MSMGVVQTGGEAARDFSSSLASTLSTVRGSLDKKKERELQKALQAEQIRQRANEMQQQERLQLLQQGIETQGNLEASRHNQATEGLSGRQIDQAGSQFDQRMGLDWAAQATSDRNAGTNEMRAGTEAKGADAESAYKLSLTRGQDNKNDTFSGLPDEAKANTMGASRNPNLSVANNLLSNHTTEMQHNAQMIADPMTTAEEKKFYRQRNIDLGKSADSLRGYIGNQIGIPASQAAPSTQPASGSQPEGTVISNGTQKLRMQNGQWVPIE